MTTQWFKDKRITVFGIGLLGGGVATIRFLAQHGAHVIATDIKTKEELRSSLDKLKDLKNITYILGQHRREDFENVDMVVKTPSCPWSNEHIKLARKNDIPVETDSSLFFQLCKNPIIGITGTKGKTTTSHFIHHILDHAGKHPVKVGIGTTPVLDRLNYLKKNSVVVFELSSWRLSALRHTEQSPQIAVFTNIFPDHLNYYKTMDKYFADKKHIYLHQKAKDTLIYNADDESLSVCEDEAPGQTMHVSLSRSTVGKSIFIEDNTVYLNDGIDAKKMTSLEKITLQGDHNKINLMLAIAATYTYGLTQKEITSSLTSLPSVPHRLEYIRTFDDVDYYNDTAATNPKAAMAALDTFDKPIILLAGGAEKDLPASSFAHKITTDTKDVVFFKGKATDRIIAEIKKIPTWEDRTFTIVSSMEEAIAAAQERAQAGDLILLSPGAASFGIFKNEFDRGSQFRKYVQEL